MGRLQPLPIAEGLWQRICIDFITDLLILGNGHDRIVTFVDPMMKGAHWPACKNTIDAPSFTRIFINDIGHLH